MDIIRIKDLEIFAKHGVLEEENVLGQKFLVSVDMMLEFKQINAFGESCDELKSTINYANVCDMIYDLMRKKTYKLIETVACDIAFTIMKEYKIIKEISVQIKKPWAPIKRSVEYVSVIKNIKRHVVYLGMGSNIDNREENIKKAINIINSDKLSNVIKESKIIETKPVGGVEQGDFLNSVIKVETLREPEDLLKLIEEIEKELKRVRLVHWGPRTIDVDILLFDDYIINNERLTIPHKYMCERRFVLEPMCMIAPEVVHPVIRKSMFELLHSLKVE